MKNPRDGGSGGYKRRVSHARQIAAYDCVRSRELQVNSKCNFISVSAGYRTAAPLLRNARAVIPTRLRYIARAAIPTRLRYIARGGDALKVRYRIIQ